MNKKLICIVGKVCSGKDTYASQLKAHKVDVGDIVRSLMKQEERIHDKSLDERIIVRLLEILQFEQAAFDVVVTGIRQESILSALNRYSPNREFEIIYLTGSLLTFKQRFEARKAQKDSHLSFEEVIKRDGELGLDQLESILKEQAQYIHTIYQPMKVTLYKRSSKGKLQQWTIETDSNMFRTTEGYVDGALTPTAWTICEGKRKGMANETTPEEQAIKEAEAKVQKQRDKGWADSPDQISEAAPKVKPKLAHKYKDHIDYVKTWKVAALMPKLDGIRALPVSQSIYSRTGKPITAAPHLLIETQHVLGGFSDNFTLDGELYNHELKYDFNEISSIVRTAKPTEEDLEKSKRLMQYHIFDVISPGSFASRYAALDTLINGAGQAYTYLKLVPCVFLKVDENFEAAAQKQYDQWLEEGYEGMMYINAESEYPHTRSKDLLKRKEMFDEEFELVDIEEGRGNKAGMAARVYCKTKSGEQFKAGIIGTEAYCKRLLASKSEVIGKMVTIQYQNLTPGNQVPRFPKMKAIRDYE